MKLEIDIKPILDRKKTYMTGHNINDFASVFITSFEIDGLQYTLNAVFDLETGVQQLVIANTDDIII